LSTVTSELPVGMSASLPETHRNHLLGSRWIDFWFLGGLSVLLWIPLYFFLNSSTLIQSLGAALPGAAIFLLTWANQPHFMASYKLAYTQGAGFVRQNWFQLIAVPVTLVVVLVFAYLYWDTVLTGHAVVAGINVAFESVGLRTRVGLYPNLGNELLGFLVHFMYFTVGWHYSKQTFGCMMVYAKFDGYSLANLQRNLIRYGLLSTWWVSWLYGHCSQGSFPFYGITVHRLDLPYLWFQIAYVVVGLMFAAIALLFILRYRSHRQLPSWNFLVPMLALLSWQVPLFGQQEFFIVIALFHSLQYFPFVAKVEITRYRQQQQRLPLARLAGFFLIMVTVGYLAFNYFPGILDSTANTMGLKGAAFFLVAAVLFINIHHYFIDNVLWRFKTKQVRELLLG